MAAKIVAGVEYTEDEMWEDYLAFVESEDGLPSSREQFVADLADGCILRVGADGVRRWTMPRSAALDAFCEAQAEAAVARARLH